MMNRQTTWHERAEKVINRVNNVFPQPENFENWGLCEELILSATTACEAEKQFNIETEIAALLLNKTALYLREQGEYEKSKYLYQRSLAIRETILNKDPLPLLKV